MKIHTLLSVMAMMALVSSCKKSDPSRAASEGGEQDRFPRQLERADDSRAETAKPSGTERERHREFSTHLDAARHSFDAHDIPATLEELDKASSINGSHCEVHNLRGSCYVEQREFDKALEEFRKAEALSKANPSIQFNIAEVLFVTKRWSEALEALDKVSGQLPAESVELSHLVNLKILLCHSALGNDEQVEAMAEKSGITDDSPYFYFAKAARFHIDHQPTIAESWLNSAREKFPDPKVLAPWFDTFVEYGWIMR
jgi:Tfp pilus assembly protein PilF